MPHQQMPEGWVDTMIAALLGLVGSIGGWLFGRFTRLEHRVTALELLQAVADERHHANIARLERIEGGIVRIEQRLDRLRERRVDDDAG